MTRVTLTREMVNSTAPGAAICRLIECYEPESTRLCTGVRKDLIERRSEIVGAERMMDAVAGKRYGHSI